MRQMNLAAHLARAGRAFSGMPAIAQGASVRLSYGELADRTSRLATSLRRRFGLRPGERVALALGNRPEYLEILYACWHAGLVAVPINAKLHPAEFAYVLDHCTARLCFTSAALGGPLSSLPAAAPRTFIEVGGGDYRRMLAEEPSPVAECAPDDAAWLFYTSGTTGRPKGALLSHRNLLAMCLCYFADVDREAPWSAILHAAPMSHGSGLYALAHVMQASCHVVPESGGFDVAEIYSLIARWPGIVFFAAPTMVKRLLDHPCEEDTRNLKAILYGGGPMYVEDLQAGIARLGPKFAQLYGQGESPMTITALSSRVIADRTHSRWRERIASVGIAQSAVEVRTVDGSDRELPAGEVGEVIVRGETVMSGYWNDPAATAETLRGGWLHTGDLGCFDPDGFLTLKDRSKDVIISAGSNIYPREVEEALLQHGDIAEVSVVGRPDREWGESVVAYVVPRAGARLEVPALDEFCTSRIARFKRPRYYRFVEALPKNNTGKVLKKELRDMESNRAD
ncbi:MAG: class I adenylate-forming enzyme family protein [Gammaproteobacteria bacterium]